MNTVLYRSFSRAFLPSISDLNEGTNFHENPNAFTVGRGQLLFLRPSHSYGHYFTSGEAATIYNVEKRTGGERVSFPHFPSLPSSWTESGSKIGPKSVTVTDFFQHFCHCNHQFFSNSGMGIAQSVAEIGFSL